MQVEIDEGCRSSRPPHSRGAAYVLRSKHAPQILALPRHRSHGLPHVSGQALITRPGRVNFGKV